MSAAILTSIEALHESLKKAKTRYAVPRKYFQRRLRKAWRLANQMSTNDQKLRFHAPLESLDSEIQTVGCRHTNPNICANHSMPRVCAFVRHDKMCLRPPASWPKQYEKLKTCVCDPSAVI